MKHDRTNQHGYAFPSVVVDAHSNLGHTEEDEAQSVRGEACRGEMVDLDHR